MVEQRLSVGRKNVQEVANMLSVTKTGSDILFMPTGVDPLFITVTFELLILPQILQF